MDVSLKKEKDEISTANYCVFYGLVNQLQTENNLRGNILLISEKGKEWFKFLEDVIIEP